MAARRPHLSAIQPHEMQPYRGVSLATRRTGPSGTYYRLAKERCRCHDRGQPRGKSIQLLGLVVLAKLAGEALHRLDAPECPDIIAEVEGSAGHIPARAASA